MRCIFVPFQNAGTAAPPGPAMFDPSQFAAPVTSFTQPSSGRLKYGQRRAYPR